MQEAYEVKARLLSHFHPLQVATFGFPGCRARPAPRKTGRLTPMAQSGIHRPWKSPLPASNSGPTPRRAGKRFPIRNATLVVFAVSPPVAAEQIQLAAIDRHFERKPVNTNFHGGSLLFHAYIRMPPEEIAALEVTWLPEITRIHADLPPLPVVHPANATPDNLFDLVIPRATIGNEKKLLEFAAGLVQFDERFQIKELTPAQRALHFPMEVENIAVRQRLARLQALYPDASVIVDSNTQTIQLQKPELVDWWEKVKKWLRL